MFHYFHIDRLFNVRGLTDFNGNILELYAYSAFGKQIILDDLGNNISSSNYTNRHGFTGRYLDEEIGLWYYRARYFSDEMGRFISRDPLGYVDGMNMYEYCMSNPLKYVDPSGLECKLKRHFALLVSKKIAARISAIVGKKVAKATARSIVLAAGDGPLPIGDIIALAWAAYDTVAIAKRVSGIKRVWGWVAEEAEDIYKQKIGQHMECLDKRPKCCRIVKATMTDLIENQMVGITGGAHGTGRANIRFRIFKTINKRLKELIDCCYTGCIYKIDGSKGKGTKSGKDYIGRHDKPEPATRGIDSDGFRDRKEATRIDTYDTRVPGAGAKAEQKAIESHGGIDNLDNKINAIKK